MIVQRIAAMKSIREDNARELAARLDTAARDPDISVVVLHGTEGIFCRGLDFSALPKDTEGSELQAVAAVEVFAGLLGKILDLPKPIIAEVDGEVRGGGVGLAAACDAVVASDRSSFGLPEMLFGLIPAVVTPVLLRRIPPQKLRFLALNCSAVDAFHARTLGLVDIVVEEHDLESTVGGLARRFARAVPEAIPALKEFIEEATARPAAEMLARGARVTGALLGKPTVRAAIDSFLLGTPPWPAKGTERPSPKQRRTEHDKR